MNLNPGSTTAKITERRLQTEVFKLRHARVLIHQRHRQTCNIPSLLVRADSEQHIDFALTHRARWKGPSSEKRFRTELEAVRRKFRNDEQALSNLHDFFL